MNNWIDVWSPVLTDWFSFIWFSLFAVWSLFVFSCWSSFLVFGSNSVLSETYVKVV